MKIKFTEEELKKFDHMGDNHIGTGAETPIHKDAFKLNDKFGKFFYYFKLN